MPPESAEGRTYRTQAARGSRGRLLMIWSLLVPCVVLAGQVIVDLSPTGRLCPPAVGSARAEDPLACSQSSARRFLVAVPPLCRVTSVAALPCRGAAGPDGRVSGTACAYRERDSGGLAFVECWAGASESSPGGPEPGSDQPTRLEVTYEPLARAERTPRESLLTVHPALDSSALVFSNPTDAQAWYSVPDTNLSSLFGGDPVPCDFEFAELAAVPLRCQVTIVAHVGGWGDIPIPEADDLVPTLEGVRAHLSAAGISSVLVPFYRSRGGLFGKLRTASEMFALHHSDASRLSWEIDRFLTRHPRQRIIMIGLSTGAAFADDVMQRLSETAEGRVCAIEIGAPFLNPSDAGESVLRLDNHDQDPVATGDYWILMRTWCQNLFRRARTGLIGEQRPKAHPFVPEHGYSWPSMRQEVISFLEAWLSR